MLLDNKASYPLDELARIHFWRTFATCRPYDDKKRPKCRSKSVTLLAFFSSFSPWLSTCSDRFATPALFFTNSRVSEISLKMNSPFPGGPSTAASLSSLPNELLGRIFSNLSSTDKTTVSKVCTHFHSLIDSFFGLPLTVSMDKLPSISTAGVSSCKIVPSLDPNDPKDALTSTLKWKYPWLLKELVIRAGLNGASQTRLLLGASDGESLINLNKLHLSWIAISHMERHSVYLMAKKLQSLADLKVYDDHSVTGSDKKLLVVPIFGNILTILQELRGLCRLSLHTPEPRAHKVLTKECFDFLQHAEALESFALSYDPDTKVPTTSWIRQFLSISSTSLDKQGKEIRPKKLGRFQFLYPGRHLHQEEAWLNFFTKGLQRMTLVHIELSRGHNISAKIPAQIVKNSETTLTSFVFKGGPQVSLALGLGQELEDVCLDFDVFRGCKKLKHLDLDLYEETRELRNLIGDPDSFPPKLQHLHLQNFVLSFQEVFFLLNSMTLQSSTLNLENVYLEELQLAVLQDHKMSEECINSIRSVAETVMKMKNIVCFTLGRLDPFPLEGIKIGGEDLEVLELNPWKKELHLHHTACVAFPSPNLVAIEDPSSSSEDDGDTEGLEEGDDFVGGGAWGGVDLRVEDYC